MARLPHRMLIVEDDPLLRKNLRIAFGNSFLVSSAGTVKTALRHLANKKYSIAILDLGLPDSSGLNVCEEISLNQPNCVVLVVTATDAISQKVKLLGAGADDYVTKPFSLDELRARVASLIRRCKVETETVGTLMSGDITLNGERREVRRAGQPIVLRRKEFALLECLILNAGNVVTRQALIDHAWDTSKAEVVSSVDVHIKLLRDKIDKPFASESIKTVYGLGYKLEADEGIVTKH